MGFVHLHNHSEYSLLDGACRIDDMVDLAVKNSVPAVALTDHGNLFGAYNFYKKSKEKGVNPILGCEVYVAPSNRKVKDKKEGSPYHLTLLAENTTGYQNLLKLVSLGYTEGFYSKPRIDMEIFREHSEGIIGLTGCIAGFVPKIISTDKEKARKNFEELIEVLGKRNLYAEVQNHYLPEEKLAYPIIRQLAEEYDIPLVGTNDCHYLTKEDHRMHDVLLCIQMKKTVNDEDRMQFANHFYFKTYDEMKIALADYPESAFTNTFEIAERCQVELDYGDNLLPKYEVPKGYTNDSYLEKLCYDGLKEKYGDISTEIKERLDYELSIIKATGYAGYFLIVWDYVKFANSQGYPLSARGSAASSLVLYALDVITFNPMDYGCFFERFLNLERVSPPDIDIDFSDRAREFVIDYLVKKYGHDSVGKVATFSTLSAKAAINDVGRALEVPSENIRTLTQLIPESANKTTLEEIMGQVPEFRKLCNKPENREIVDLALKVEGMKRHVSCHASAIVVSNGPLMDYVPLFKDKNDQVATQFEGKTIEEIGIVKFDSLGVRSLTKVYDCIEFIKENQGKEVKYEDIPFDDKETYKLINKGLIEGLFQLETSPGMKNVVSQLKPDDFEEFSAIPALYRPGPLKSGMMQQFINRKNGLEPVEYLHPLLEETLEKTFGVCIYQEQVMQLARDLAGFTMGEADVLRSAMGKKNKKLLMEQKDKFIKGAKENGIEVSDAENIFELLEPFGTYAFNKSHTVAYSILSYRMAYLKRHYPHEFMAAIMSNESGSADKIIRYRNECEALSDFLSIKIDSLPPDINHSQKGFTVKDNRIQFGLSIIKNVGESAIEEILEQRKKGGPFKTLNDFCERINSKQVTKRTIESLIISGATDSLEGNRAYKYTNLEDIMKLTQSSQSDKERGQSSFFDIFDDFKETESSAGTLKEVEEWGILERLKKEKEQLGFYISGHPLEEYKQIIDNYTSITSQSLKDQTLKSTVYVLGILSEIRRITTKKGDAMASLTFEDIEGTFEAVLFPESYKRYAKLIEEDQPFWIKGTVDAKYRRSKKKDSEKQDRQVLINLIEPLSTVVANQTTDVEVVIPEEDIENLEKLKKLREIAEKSQGSKNLLLHLTTAKSGTVLAQSSDSYKIEYSDDIIAAVEDIFGKGSIYSSNKTVRLPGKEIQEFV